MWVNAEESLPEIKSRGETVKVRLNDDKELSAYFYKDKMQWIETYGKKPCHFWDCKTHEPLHAVTHWKYLN